MSGNAMPGAGHTGRILEERKSLRSSLAQPHCSTEDAPRQALFGAHGRVVAITDKATGTVYRTTIADLHKHGWVLQRDADKQIAMRLSRWSVNGAPPADAPRPSPSPAPAAQLSLW